MKAWSYDFQLSRSPNKFGIQEVEINFGEMEGGGVPDPKTSDDGLTQDSERSVPMYNLMYIHRTATVE